MGDKNIRGSTEQRVTNVFMALISNGPQKYSWSYGAKGDKYFRGTYHLHGRLKTNFAALFVRLDLRTLNMQRKLIRRPS